jgi:L-xylulokinase
MSGAGLLRLPESAYDAGLLSLYGLSDAMLLLPRLCQPTEVVGHVTPSAAFATGLRAGIPVVAGYFDVVASALGSGAVGPGAASIVLGSWSINQVFADTPARDPNVFMVAAFGPGRFANMDNSATSAANLEWYVRTLVERDGHHGDAFALVNDLVGRAAMLPDAPMFHPFLYGGRHGAHQRGGFYGLAGWHDEGHLLRALYEGVAFEHRRHIETLTKGGAQIREVFLSGGGTRSPHWPQMMADVLGLPVRLGNAEETGALGGAMAAAVGIGLHATEDAAVAVMTMQRAVLFPDPDRKSLHDRRFAVWKRLTVAMEAFWADLSDLGQP